MPPVERVVFFGTPAIAVPTLAALCDAGRSPVLVVTQPARPAGRGKQLRQPPVAEWALERGLDVMQPERVREPSFVASLEALHPDVAVVAAFGQIFPVTLLELFPQGCINLHTSLLPRHRGAAPIQAAIAAGDPVTGVTSMLMERGLDTGPMLLQREVAIGAHEEAGELSERLAALAAEVAIDTLVGIEAGDLTPRPQANELATHAPSLTREDGVVDWSLPAEVIERRGRAFSPWPGIATVFRDESIKLLEVEVGERAEEPAEPGTFLGLSSDSLRVACGEDSVLDVVRLQRPGKKGVGGRDFANGLRLEPGMRFD
jgi:methionyl-tRNA formyltransferase